MLAEAMPLAWQNAMTQIMAEFQQAHGHLTWPEYRVVPSRRERLVDLDEDQLAEVGCIMEIDADGAVVYRERNGKLIANPESTEVLVSCLDPIPLEQSNANDETPPRGFPAPPVQQRLPWS
jgi:biotin-(acetyl-CoA carboxylase) ligase